MAKVHKMTIANHSVAVTSVGERPGATIYWIMMAAHRDNLATMAALIAERTDAPFRLVACDVNDWDHELSPWPAENVTGQDDFTGEAPAFLDWLLWDCIPAIEGWERPRDPIDKSAHDLAADAEGPVPRIIGGYSMAGLFAAWAYLKTTAFQGMASASGSLWYPHWLSWAAKQTPREDGVTYLSLGTKEPRVKNPIVATVGEATEATAQLLAQASAGAHTMVWNPGGHFNQPQERMAAGFAWTLDAMRKRRV